MGSRRIAPDTMAVLEFLAEGHRPKDIAVSLGISVHNVYQTRSRYQDVIYEIQGKKADGTPARFAPGCGAESIAKIERGEEEETAIPQPPSVTAPFTQGSHAAGASPRPTETQPEEPRKHSVAELFQEIEALKVEKTQLLGKVDAREAELEKVSEMLAIAERELKRGVMEIRFTDLLPIMFFDLYGEDLNAEFVKGYLCALNSIFKHDDIRKEMEKNARPKED